MKSPKLYLLLSACLAIQPMGNICRYFRSINITFVLPFFTYKIKFPNSLNILNNFRDDFEVKTDIWVHVLCTKV